FALTLGVVIKEIREPKELTTEIYTSLDLSFSVQDVQKILLGKDAQGAAVELVKDNDVWKIPLLWNAKADQAKVYDFLKKLRAMKGELRVSDPSLFMDFKIGDEEALKIRLVDFTGREVLNLLLGASVSAAAETFVRKVGSKDVYMADLNLWPLMGIYGDPGTETLSNNFWSDLRPITIDVGEIREIAIKRFEKGKEKITTGLVRGIDQKDADKKMWRYSGKDLALKVDENKVKDFLQTLSRWQAEEVLNPEAQDYGFKNPFLELRFVTESTREIVLTVARENEKSKVYFVRVSTEPVVYKTSEYYVQKLDTADSAFVLQESGSQETKSEPSAKST
ncbi:MAG: DUF4340 domain-containing protein, partial [Candidatus Omnitrophica bacterium]|nr:DUF4340 domain-containing protein [Candidatus Omnitrophota bacterium]